MQGLHKFLSNLWSNQSIRSPPPSTVLAIESRDAMNTVNPLGLVSECHEAEDTLIFSIEAMSVFGSLFCNSCRTKMRSLFSGTSWLTMEKMGAKLRVEKSADNEMKLKVHRVVCYLCFSLQWNKFYSS